jgi:hypothetical protein
MSSGADSLPTTQVTGRGLLRGKPAELFQVRKRLGNPTSGKNGALLSAAIVSSATAARRAEFQAAMASFEAGEEKAPK